MFATAYYNKQTQNHTDNHNSSEELIENDLKFLTDNKIACQS